MMPPESGSLLPHPGEEVEFACGGVAPYTQDIPVALYNGKPIYFCLSACQQTFERDPEKFLSGAIPHFEDL